MYREGLQTSFSPRWKSCKTRAGLFMCGKGLKGLKSSESRAGLFRYRESL